MGKNVKPLTPKRRPKMSAYEPKITESAIWKIAEPPVGRPRPIEKYLQIIFFNFSRRATGFEIWPFKVEIPVQAIFPLYL